MTATRLQFAGEAIITTDTEPSGAPETVDPLGGLPAPEPVVFDANFIDLAVAEVRFDVPVVDPARRSVVTTSQGLALREHAAAQEVPLPTVEPSERQETRVDVTPAGPVTQSNSSSGVQLTTTDRKLAVSVFGDLLTVQHTDYARFGRSFRRVLRAMLTGVKEQLAPVVVRRIGLRYVNRLVDAQARTADAWLDRIHPAALGVLTDPAIAALVQGTQQQVQLDFGDAAGAVLRHGAFADPAVHGAFSYLIDLDVYMQAGDYFDVEAIMSRVRQLNVTALSLFQWVVTPQWRATMGPHPIEHDAPSEEVVGETLGSKSGEQSRQRVTDHAADDVRQPSGDDERADHHVDGDDGDDIDGDGSGDDQEGS